MIYEKGFYLLNLIAWLLIAFSGYSIGYSEAVATGLAMSSVTGVAFIIHKFYVGFKLS